MLNRFDQAVGQIAHGFIFYYMLDTYRIMPDNNNEVTKMMKNIIFICLVLLFFMSCDIFNNHQYVIVDAGTKIDWSSDITEASDTQQFAVDAQNADQKKIIAMFALGNIYFVKCSGNPVLVKYILGSVKTSDGFDYKTIDAALVTISDGSSVWVPGKSLTNYWVYR